MNIVCCRRISFYPCFSIALYKNKNFIEKMGTVQYHMNTMLQWNVSFSRSIFRNTTSHRLHRGKTFGGKHCQNVISERNKKTVAVIGGPRGPW